MTPKRSSALTVYLTCVISAAITVMAALSRRAIGPLSIGAIVLFATFAVCCELKPLRWLGPRGRGEVTASWTFLLGLFFLMPPTPAALATIAVVLAADTIRRAPLARALFNACQIALSVLVGVAIVEPFQTVAAPLDRASAGWLVAAIVVGIVAITLNSCFTLVAVGLSEGRNPIDLLRSFFGVNLAMEFILIALAPAMVVLVRSGLLVVVLMTTTVWAVYKTAELALAHHHEATHDLLTALPNRRSFFEQAATVVATAQRKQQTFAVLHIDLDGFKGINDRLGHHVGDRVLQAVGDRLLSIARKSDLVARLGGDEFAILLPPQTNAAEASELADEVRECLAQAMHIDGVPLAVGGSIGIAVYPDHGEDIDTLLSNADAAMYRAKAGRSGPQMFESGNERVTPTRMKLISEMSRAIDEHELILEYQPKIDFIDDHIVGAEALVRWYHPSLGRLMPASFMQTAEQTELMHSLTRYILREALTQTKRWHAEGLMLSVAVNVSSRNLHDRSFATEVARLLTELGVDGIWLEVEITENTVMTDPARSARALADLRELGVQVSIDDFGTGYSSLANLRTLPIDRVKIDKTFVSSMLTNVQDASIVRSIIELSMNLGLGTVAEGIEDAEVLEVLREMGCQFGQGYYIGAPMSGQELSNAVRSQGSAEIVREYR